MWSWSIQSACALGRERFALLSYDDEVAYDDPDRVLTVRLADGPEPIRALALRGDLVRICRVDDVDASLVALSSDGSLALISSSGKTIASEQIGVGAQAINPYGSLTTVRQIGGQLYACGMGGQVHQRTGANHWRLISKELCSENIYERWFSNVDGSSSSRLLAAGLDGALYFFDGHAWKKIETSTTAPLGEMAFLDDGSVYVAGAQSTLLHGKPEHGLSKVALISRDLTLYTVCRFRKRMFIGTERGVFEFDEATRNLLPVDLNVDAAGEIILLESIGDVMWAFGSKFVRRYDGSTWLSYDRYL